MVKMLESCAQGSCYCFFSNILFKVNTYKIMKYVSLLLDFIMQTPTLTQISPNSVVSPGEVLQFRCTIPSTTYISVDFSLYKTGTVIKKQTAESKTTFNLTVDASHQGQYTCDYSYRESNSSSSRSNSITITVGK